MHGQGVDGVVCGMLGGRVVMWKCGVAGWDGGEGELNVGTFCWTVMLSKCPIASPRPRQRML